MSLSVIRDGRVTDLLDGSEAPAVKTTIPMRAARRAMPTKPAPMRCS